MITRTGVWLTGMRVPKTASLTPVAFRDSTATRPRPGGSTAAGRHGTTCLRTSGCPLRLALIRALSFGYHQAKRGLARPPVRQNRYIDIGRTCLDGRPRP